MLRFALLAAAVAGGLPDGTAARPSHDGLGWLESGDRGWRSTRPFRLSDPDLSRRVRALAGQDPVVYKNPEPPAGSTDPLANAVYKYPRLAAFSGGRFTPFDLNITAWDRAGNEITHHPAVLLAVGQLFDDVYQWNVGAWKSGLRRCCPHTDINATLDEKANMFWELLSEIYATRALGVVAVKDRMLAYGPACFDNAMQFNCTAGPAVPGVHTLSLVTHVDGARDNLNPVSRIISWSGSAPQAPAAAVPGAVPAVPPSLPASPSFVAYPTVYTIVVPGGMQVASVHRELLDERPSIAGARLGTAVRIHAAATLGSYPDYNLPFIPLRHLVMQGHVQSPMRPGSSLSYSTAAALVAKFNATTARLFAPGSAAKVVGELRPFFNESYYYMYPEHNFSWNGVGGIPGYADYILDPPVGIAAGLGARLSKVALELGGVTAATVTAADHVRAPTSWR